MVNLNDILDELDPGDLEEIPVDIDEFLRGEDYLNRKEIRLSDEQRKAALAMTQIYRLHTLLEFLEPDEAARRHAQTMNEVVLMWGKGSGKDMLSEVACCYLIYLLLCLRDPAAYYGKPSGDSIDILNVAQNAAQANNVFFKGVTRFIQKSNWFKGRYESKPDGGSLKSGEFNFDKNINLYSAHSERESWEGYNTFLVVLDEISGFNLEASSGNPNAKTAESIYLMYRASVTSRFAEYGKIVSLSFPRYKGDFISSRYDDEVVSKNTQTKSHTFKLDPELPDGQEGNEFTIEWDYDTNLQYRTPKVYVSKRATFEVNPQKRVDDYVRDFYTDRQDTLGRVCCMPPETVDAFFKDKEKVENALVRRNGVDDWGQFTEEFKPKPHKKYFVHVDLARVHDHCAVTMAHVEAFRKMKLHNYVSEPLPVVHVDVVRWWTPTKEKSVDFTDVKDFIVSLQRRGFDLGLVTFDRWESDDVMQYLRQYGIRTERLSVAKKHYVDLAGILHEERLVAPDINLLKKEMLQLRLLPNDKIDHPRTGSKDLIDSMCGAVYDAVAHTHRDETEEVDIFTYDQNREVRRNHLPENTIVAPKMQMPKELEDYLSRIGTV